MKKSMTIKLLSFVGIAGLSIFLSGCGGVKKLSPAEITNNSSIKVFIDESASEARAKSFLGRLERIN